LCKTQGLNWVFQPDGKFKCEELKVI
jgi:hypothetical protein